MQQAILIILILFATFLAVKMSVADLRRRIIPDVYLWPFMLTGLIIVHFFDWPINIGESVIAAAFGYTLGIGVGWIFKKSLEFRVESRDNNADNNLNSKLSTRGSPIGLGDVKLLAAGGVWLGATGLAIAIVASCIFGGIWGLRKKQRFIPFAPFFFVGGICALIALLFLI